MKLSGHFTLEELTRSDKAAELGLENKPGIEELKNLINLCKYVLEPLRNEIGVPIIITSGYRSPELNKAVGGEPDSQHTKGQAADIVTPGYNLKDAFKIITEKLIYDQAIYEEHSGGDWIHVSYEHGANRRMPLLAKFRNGKAEYIRA